MLPARYSVSLLVQLFAIILLTTGTDVIERSLKDNEIAGERFMAECNKDVLLESHEQAVANWAYDSNITKFNERSKNELSAEIAKKSKERTLKLKSFHYASFKNPDLRRQFEKMASLGDSALPDDKYRKLSDALSAMQANYAKVRVCDFKNKNKCNLQLEPELSDIIENSRDPEELKFYWKQWYDKAGAPVRKNFDIYVKLRNEAAVLNNFTSGAESWLDAYEDPNFEQNLEDIFEKIRPLYEQLHAYVRHKLKSTYGSNLIKDDQPIPMHLLGNMWGQTWEHIASLTTPYPTRPLLDVTPEMLKQNYTALKMFQMGDDFYQSLNFTKLPQKFWENSIIKKPTDGRDLICHASAWDFYQPPDFRIKMCTRVTMEELFTIHHEMGHIQYYMQYQHLPAVYRGGANPGFHEAVGDVMSLSVSSPKHLIKIGLLKDYKFDEEDKINQLFKTALEKIIFLPFAFTLDKYRWSIFRKEIPDDQYNCRFWKLREEYSGIVPPMARSEKDFDPAAKYHISSDTEYLRYLVSFIVQFQFHKSVCEKAGEYEAGNPDKTLSNCDIYQSANAGNAFKAMLALGSSRPWPDAMEVLTGSRKIDASAILEYFEPLKNWLIKTNKASGAYIGWKKSYKCA